MPYDIIEEEAPESGGYEVLEETPGELGGIVNSFQRGNLAAQRAIEAVQMTPERGPTMRQGRRGFVQAMEDPQYLNRLMAAGDDAEAMRKAESLFGPGRRVATMTEPQRQANIATAGAIADLTQRIDAVPQSAAMQEWAKADNSNWWAVFARNPVEITANIFAESLPQAAPSMAATMATGGLGRVASATAGGAGSFGVEAANSLVEAAASQGVDLHDPEQVRAFFADETKVKAAREFAMQRGFPIALLDALTIGVAGKFLKPALGKGAARVAGATAAEAGVQMAGGAGGEALAQAASGQDLSLKDIAAEAIGELATAPGEIVGNIRAETRNRGFEVIEDSAERGIRNAEPAAPAPSVDDLKALEAAMRGNQLKPQESGGRSQETAKPAAQDIVMADLPSTSQEQLTRRMTAPPVEPEPIKALPPVSVQYQPTEEMRAALEFQKRTDEAFQKALENPDKNYDAMTRQELEMLDSLGDAQAKAALRRMPRQPAAAATSGKTILTGEGFRKRLNELNGDMPQADLELVATPVQAAIDNGQRVTLIADGKPIPIVAVANGMLEDEKGQRWGTFGIATDRSGNWRLEIDGPQTPPPIPANLEPEPLQPATVPEPTTELPQISSKVVEPKPETDADRVRREAKEFDKLTAAMQAQEETKQAAKEFEAKNQPDLIESALDKLKIETPPGSLQAFGLLPETWNQLIEIVRAAYRGGKTAAQAIRAGMDWLQAQGAKDYDAAGIQAHFEKELDRSGDYLRGAGGKPLLMHRGTLVGISLRPSDHPGGVHFSDNKAYASEYSMDPDKIRDGRLESRYLYFRKPLDLRPLFEREQITVGDVRALLTRSGVPMDMPMADWFVRNGYGELWAPPNGTLGDVLKSWGNDNTRLDDFNPNMDLTDGMGAGLKRLGFDGILFPEHGKGGDLTAVALKDYVVRRNATGGDFATSASAGIKAASETQPSSPRRSSSTNSDFSEFGRTLVRTAQGQADKGNMSALRTEATSALTSESKPESGASVNSTNDVQPSDSIEAALDKAIAATDFKPGQVNEGVTGAPIWLTRAAANGALRLLRTAYRGAQSLAQAVNEAVDWLRSQNLAGFNEAEARAWLEQQAQGEEQRATTLEDLQQRLERLELQIIRSRRRGTAQATRALLDERARLQEEFNALRYGAEEEAQAAEARPATTIPTFTQSQLDSVSSATMDGTPTAESFWNGLKRFFRQFATNTPEIAVLGEEAEKASLFRRGVRLFGVETQNARRTAARSINQVLEPLKALGRDVTNPDAVDKFFALGKRIKREEARANPNEEKLATLREQQQAVRGTLEGNPWYLFQQAVLWRDLWYRKKFLKTPSGGEITLPGGLEIDQVESAMARNKELIDANPHAAAIRDSLRRHYQLMADLQESLLQHGELIPDELRNPLYFPHHLLEKFTGSLDRARPTTEKDFRAYLIAPVGSDKLIEAGYLNALYKHVNDVTVHNARADVVEKYWRPYDEAGKRQQELEADAAERGEEIDPDAWKRNVPPGMELFTPSEEIPMRADYILNRGELGRALGVALPANGDLRGVLQQIGADIRLTGDMIQKAMVAGERPQWLLPSEIAEAIRGIVKREESKSAVGPGKTLGRWLSKPLQAWKGNTLFNWYNYPRYEWGNTITDVIDKMLGADPGMARYLGRALKEVRAAANGERTTEFESAEREGVLQSVTAQEVSELAKLPDFEDFLTTKQWRMEKVRKFITWTARASALRESTFRYAKFLADLERIRRGEQPVYAGAYWRDVQAAKTPEAKAAEITLKTFGDYGNLSVVGNFLREHVIPFWSWQEINLKYHANLFRNLRDMLTLPAEERPGGTGAAARAAAVATASFTGRAAVAIALRLALMRLGIEMWNQFGGAWAGLWDDDDDLEGQLSEADRRRFHLLLGKDAQGRARVVYIPNALSDVAEWFGGNNFARLFTEWAKGDIPFGQFVTDFAKQAPADLVNKVVQGARPDAKFAYMAVSGKDPFPDITDQRDISRENLGWMLMQTVTDRDAATFLRSQLDKDYYAPEGLGDWLGRKLLQIRRRDPEQWAYYEIRDKAADWKEAHTGKRNEGFDYQSPDQQVIRNFRKAIYRGDLDNAVRFYNRLRDYGYTNQRFAASIRNADPLSDLTRLEKRDFEQGLTQYERELLARARRYYARLASSKGRERALFPSNPRSAARPSEERIKQLLAPRE